MKKLLVVLMAAVMVLSLAAVAMAEVTVGGELKYIIKHNSAAADDESEDTDAVEAKVTFTGKLNDNVTAFVAAKSKLAGEMPVKDTDTDTGSSVTDKEYKVGSFYLDEYHMTFAYGAFTTKAGYWGYKLTPSLDVIKNYGMKEIKAPVMIASDYAINDQFTIGLAYLFDGETVSKGDVPTLDGAYDVKLAYKSDLFGGEVHVADNGADDQSGMMALDVYVQPIDMFKGYVTYMTTDYFDDADVDPSMIVGVYVTPVAGLYVRFEYNVTDYDLDFNEWGTKVGYNFQNGLTLEYKRAHTINFSDGSDSFSTEISGKVKF